MIILKTIDYNLILIESKYSANSIGMIIHYYQQYTFRLLAKKKII